MSPNLNNHQFRGKLKKDPVHDKRRPSFSGGTGSKTMLVERPHGLPTPPAKHPHRRHAGHISRRAK